MRQRFDHPAQPACPYPPDWGGLSDPRYDSDLVLVRLKDAVQLREGENADYVVGTDYSAQLRVDCEVSGITVPRGLLTDLTSVPARAPLDRDRAFADLVTLRAVEAAQVNVVIRRLIYAAERMIGARAFRRINEDRYVKLPDHLGGLSLPQR